MKKHEWNIRYWEFIIVYLFMDTSKPCIIKFKKSGKNLLNEKEFNWTVERKVSLDYALRYLIKHNMKMGKYPDSNFFIAEKFFH